MAQVERKLQPSADRAQRPNRIPISGRRDILSVRGKEPGFEYRVVKDAPGRVDMLMDAGYEIVSHDVEVGQKRVGVPAQEGSPVRMSLGGGHQGYLMRQKKEWYDEDQKAKQDAITAAEAGMKSRELREHYGTIEVDTGSRKA